MTSAEPEPARVPSARSMSVNGFVSFITLTSSPSGAFLTEYARAT